MTRNTYFLAALLWFLIPGGAVLAQNAPVITGKIVDPTAPAPQGVHGIGVNVVMLMPDGTEGVAIGLAISDAVGEHVGEYTVTCNRAADRILIVFFDTDEGRIREGSLYAQVGFKPLSGQRNIVLSPVLLSTKSFSPREMRESVRNLEGTLPVHPTIWGGVP